MRKLHIGAAAIAAALTLGASSAAQAVVYNLNIDHCTGGCASGSPPFATVTVLQNGANLDFTVQLLDSLVFQNSTAFDAFAFGFSDKVATVTSIVDNGPGTFTSSPACDLGHDVARLPWAGLRVPTIKTQGFVRLIAKNEAWAGVVCTAPAMNVEI